MNDLTQGILKDLLHYDAETGIFLWKKDRARRNFIGKIAGCLNRSGYLVIRINGKNHRAHRLVWLYMTGEWPEGEIDHKDRNKENNRWINLREATQSENFRNSKARGRANLKGASWNNKTKNWHPSITVNRKRIKLGQYDCPAAAHFEYVIAAHKNYGEFARFS